MGKSDLNTASAEELKALVEELRAKISAMESEHSAELSRLKLECAVERELLAAGARNVKAARALIELPKNAAVGKDGDVPGLREAVAAAKLDAPYLFGGAGVEITGALPAESGADMPDFSKMTYSQVSDFLEKNPGFDLGLGGVL